MAFIWKQDKNACQQMGKEMIRFLSSLTTVPELQPMFQDLRKTNLVTNQTLFYQLLVDQIQNNVGSPAK